MVLGGSEVLDVLNSGYCNAEVRNILTLVVQN